MTPADFAAARLRMGRTQESLANALGVSGTVVGHYERGRVAVPEDVRQTMLRMTSRIGGKCRCGNTIVVEWHDWPARCGACTQPMPEDR